MATKSKLELAVDAGKWEDGLKKAQASMDKFSESVGGIGKMTEAQKEKVAKFVDMMGEIGSKATSVKGQMREYKNTIQSLQLAYKQLSETDKKGVLGQQMLSSIDKLKGKLAELTDMTADLDQELKHMASDTAFSDGMNMMAGTIGNCASAVVAWTGDGKEMEEVIKDLAKIQTTIAAVESLTKAFQKQNLVLMKNPYVLAATAIAAVGMALYELSKKETEAEKEAKRLAEETKKAEDAYRSMEKSLAGSAATVEAKFASLQSQWMNVRGTALETSWIEQNKNAFSDMAGAIDSVNKANDFYVNHAEDVIKAMKAIALASKYQEEYATARVELDKHKADTKGKKYSLGHKYNTGSVVSLEAIHNNNLVSGDDYTTKTLEDGVSFYHLTESGKRKMNNNQIFKSDEYKADQATQQRLQEQVNYLEEAANKAFQESMDAKLGLGNLGFGTNNNNNNNNNKEFTVQLDIPDIDTAPIFGVTKSMKQLNEELARYKKMKGEAQDKFTAGIAEAGIKQKETEIKLQPVALEFGLDTEQLIPIQESIDNFFKKNPIELLPTDYFKNFNFGGVSETAQDTASAWQAATRAISSAGSAMTNLEDPSAKVAGIVMQAIANVALGFAQASASQATGAAGVFGWIAAATAGVATMTATIAQIKSATEYHADGGMVGMSPFIPKGTDTVPAMLTPGEIVLNAAQQRNMADNLQGNTLVTGGTFKMELIGDQLIGVINNTLTEQGKQKIG